MALVLLVEELTTRVVQLTSASIRGGLEDVTGLEETLANIGVDLGDPVAETLIVLSVDGEVVEGVEDGLE